MRSLHLRFVEGFSFGANMTSITVFGKNIRKDDDGRFSLNDLHKAAMAKGHATDSHAPSKFLRNDGVQAFIAEIDSKNNDLESDGQKRASVKSTKGGKSQGSFACELVAMRYAGWISASVEVEVYKTFQKVIHADEGLTADLIDRQTDPDASKRLAARAQGKATRNHFTDTLKNHGVNGVGYARCTDAIYKPLLGGTAKQIKSERGLLEKTNLRERMTRLELVASMFAEEVAIERISAAKAQGNHECERHSREAGEETKAVISKSAALS